ncbi:hypothetical protein [Sediminibacillus massiliensis]|uniref:hypothetical protein n=1 Tax=Sediminibacillus massiliensis TaxID=1926277 RepID=UPI0009887263|nr:hypothetical protein [Sediminibacillus massiliensis]
MNVTNDGSNIRISSTFQETAALVEAVGKGAAEYRREGSIELAEEAEQIADQLRNPKLKLD